MVDTKYLNTLRIIHDKLKNSSITWVITGSLGMALQGVDVEINDIDIQTTHNGAYDIELLFSEFVVEPVSYLISEKIRSHLGKLQITGIEVEIMGGIQKRLEDQTWEMPINLENHRCWLNIDKMHIPVLSLEYEYQAYQKLGRIEKAEILKIWLSKQ